MNLLVGARLRKQSPGTVEFTSSVKDDKWILQPGIKVNVVHMIMLVRQGIVKAEQGAKCIEALLSMPETLDLDPALEDVHMNVEDFVIKKVGKDIGGQLNLAKSRNDQVATSIRIRLRETILEVASALTEFRRIILELASRHLKTIMPGYTHLQHAQPVTLAHHLLAHHDAFARDFDRIASGYGRINSCPMGAAALATTTFRIDRKLVSNLLGFESLVENSIDAVSARDFAVESISTLSLIMSNLSRIAEEFVLWSSSEFGLVEIADEYASTSSIMPQKKNPVVAELVRAKYSTVLGDLVSSLTILKALPYSYNLDLQELTPHLWSACESTLSSLRVFQKMLGTAKFNLERLRSLLDKTLVATDVANFLVEKYGLNFRIAHSIVASLVRQYGESGLDHANKLQRLIRKETGKSVHIDENELKKVTDPKSSIYRSPVLGGPNPKSVLAMIIAGKKLLDKHRAWTSRKKLLLKNAESRLKASISKLKGGEIA